MLKDTPIDRHAGDQTQTVYTAVRNFSMLPTELSTDMTSLNEKEDRAAHVVEFLVDAQGAVTQASMYRAVVRKAQLAYSHVGPVAGADGRAATKGGCFCGIVGAVEAAA